MENEKFYFQLFWKNTDILYFGSWNIITILKVYQDVFKDSLELRVVTEKNPCSIWKEL